ncbi:transglutaminase family protein [Rarobacter incanus]|uniref:Transglutaminase-like putative cysteine protease n=1 Tax=Rarobacter incanus TaxID=153494 RepID=A0A542SMW3_9MICO|nr:transglutaminase family protein [Rarobacter incanus]TQK75952.1 transglutaminase-like putative cysteine protease [Rarobacter incanus]
MNRYEVVHTNAFKYQDTVRASYNEARMIPVAGRGQRIVDVSVNIDPLSSRYDYTDYWGTRVVSFEVLRPHDHLTLVAASLVELAGPEGFDDPSATWEDLRDPALCDRQSVYLTHSHVTVVPDDVRALALDCIEGNSPHQAALLISDAIRDAMEYVPGVTTVHTPASEAWQERKGVCQDIAHLTVGALRSVGIPALYVSGYYDPRAAADLDQETVVGQSHAWVEWWAGSWRPYDPTNRVVAGDQHVVVGRGREYDDVPPFKGVFAGGGRSELDVSVAMTLKN